MRIAKASVLKWTLLSSLAALSAYGLITSNSKGECASLTIVGHQIPSRPTWPIENAQTLFKFFINDLSGLPVGSDCQLDIRWTITKWKKDEIERTQKEAQQFGIFTSQPPQQLGLSIKVSQAGRVLGNSELSFGTGIFSAGLNDALQLFYSKNIFASKIDPFAPSDQEDLAMRLCDAGSRENVYDFLSKLPNEVVISSQDESGYYGMFPVRISNQFGDYTPDAIFKKLNKKWFYDGTVANDHIFKYYYPQYSSIFRRSTDYKRYPKRYPIIESKTKITSLNTLRHEQLGVILDSPYNGNLLNDIPFIGKVNGTLSIVVMRYTNTDGNEVSYISPMIDNYRPSFHRGQQVYCHIDPDSEEKFKEPQYDAIKLRGRNRL